MEQACQLLTEHRAQLDKLAQTLLREDSLNEREILDVTGILSRNPRDAGDRD
jgi:ATP-dependent Zn protease